MDEIHAKLADMRGAAERMRTAGRRIEISITSAAGTLDGLFALGLSAPGLQARYLAVRSEMAEWSGALARFADELTDAADAVEAASRGERYAFRVGGTPRPAPPPPPPEALPPAPTAPVLGVVGYLAAHNAPLYALWERRQDALTEKEGALAALVTTRETRAADLEALRARLYSYDPSLDVGEVPRVAALESSLAQLDADILTLEGEIDTAQARLDAVASRLERVLPGPGADLELIASMEGTSSPAWLGENTFDCVAHVVDKFHVPPEIARDARLWIEKAAEFSEYGVTVGDTPAAGAVLWMDVDHPYSDSQYGHVMYVERVENGAVWVTDNNHPTDPVRLDAITTEARTGIKYLYFPWHTRG